jgi:putative transposase
LTKRRRRHTPDQIVAKLKDADALLNVGQSLAQTLQKLEITESTYHRWRAQFGGMKAEEAKRLKKLEKENARLKKLIADAELDKAMLKELLEGKW